MGRVQEERILGNRGRVKERCGETLEVGGGDRCKLAIAELRRE